MKTVFKQFSKKTLSLIIALAVVICSFGTTLSTFMDFGAKAVGVEHFEVTYGSPAVPMFEKTTINLYDLRVQFAKDGDFVNGTDITWSAEAGTSAAEFLNATNKTFSALGTGIFKVTATETANTANTKTVYIMANKQDDYDFYLVNLDFENNPDCFNVNDWMYASTKTTSDSKNANVTPKDALIYKQAIPSQGWGFYFPSSSRDYFDFFQNNNTHIMFYKADILKDFADYTFDAKVAVEGDYAVDSPRAFLLRANVNFDAPLYSTESGATNKTIFEDAVSSGVDGSALYLARRRYGAVYMGSYCMDPIAATTYTRGADNIGLHSLSGDNYLKVVNASDTIQTNGAAVGDYPAGDPAYTLSFGVTRDISIKLKGKDVLYKIGGNVLLDTTKTVYKLSTPNKLSTAVNEEFTDFATKQESGVTTAAGNAIGFSTNQGSIRVYSLKVKLNDIVSAEDMPIASEINFETITVDNPVINITTNTEFDLSNYIYQFENGSHLGSAVEFTFGDTNASVNETYATISGKNFTATQPGIYAIEVAYGNEKTTVYVYVTATENAEFYSVTDRSPAVPMFVNTRTDIGNIAVQFKNGQYFYGRDITWTIDESNSNDSGIVLSNENKTLAPIATGTFVLKATVVTDNGTLSRKVYFVANNKGDNDFYLVDLNLAAGGYVPGEWMLLKTKYGDYTDSTKFTVNEAPADALKTNGVCAPGGEGNLLIYKNEMLMDFADYTIVSEVVARNFFASLGGQFGLVGRANVNFDAAIGSNSPFATRADGSAPALGVVSQPFGSPMIHVFNKSFCGTAINVWEKYGYNTLSNIALITPSTANSDYVLSTGGESLKSTNVELKFDGSNIKYTFGSNVLLDTSAATINVTSAAAGGGNEGQAMADSHFTSEGTITNAEFAAMFNSKATTGAGTIGLFNVRVYDDYVVAKTLKVKLNSANVPAYTEYNPYIVKSTSPALPMTAGTKVNTSDFMIQLGAFAYEASALDYSAVTAVQNGAVANGVKVENGEILAYKRGVYSVTVTANDGSNRSQKIYIVVKNPDENEYVIYDKDYRGDGVDVSDWTTTVTDDSGNIVANGKYFTEYERKTETENENFTPNYDYMLTTKTENGVKYYIYHKATSTVALNFSGNYADKLGVNGFVPYDTTVFQNGFSITKAVTYSPVNVYTTLNNAVVNALADYTVTASFKASPGNRGAIGVMGRVNGTSGYGFGAGTKESYNIPGTVPLNAPFAIVGTALSAFTDNAGVSNYFYNSVGGNNYTYRVYSVKYSGSTMSLSAPDGSTETVSGIANTAGKVGFVTYNKDTFSGYNATPVLAEFKVSIKDVDLSNLPTSAISGYTAETTTKSPVYVADNNVKFTLNSDKVLSGFALINSSKPYPEKMIIPSVVDGVKTTAINYNVFKISTTDDNKALSKTLGEVVISDGILTIYDSAFNGHRNLDKITLPNTLETIGESAFSTTGIIDIVIPSSTLTIGKYAFSGAASLRTLVIGSEQDKTERLYKSQLTTITDLAFQKCSSLQVVELPMNVKKIGASAFKDCTMLDKLYVYSRTAVFGSAVVPVTTTIYGATGSTAEAYANANGNPFVAIDTEVAAVEQAYADYLAALEAAAQLKTNTVDTGAKYLFYKKTNDETGGVAGLIPSNPNAGKFVLPLIGSYTSDITGQTFTDFKVTYVYANAFKECEYKSSIYNIVIPEGYIEIQDSAFAGCTELRYITLPNTLNYIRNYAFTNNTWLKSIELPKNLGEIGKGAFQSSGRLANVTFAESSACYSIGESAFQGTAIETIKLPVLLRNIGAKAFADTPLTDVYIYNRDAIIGKDAFPTGTTIHGVAGSTAQTYANENGLTFVADVTDTWDSTINKVDSNGKFTYKVSADGVYSAASYSAGGKVVIPYEIDYKAEDGTVTKGALVTAAGINFFKNVYYRFQVTALEVPEGVTTIQDSSFIGCANLVSLKIPSTLQRVEKWAFSSADIHGELVFGINCNFIGQSAFANNNNLKAVYIYNPNCVIEDDAFVYSTNTSINEKVTEEQRIKIYGVKGSTAETYASKNGHEFIEIQAGKFPEISEIKDNGNYVLTGDAATNTVVGYARKDASKPYSEKVVFPAKLNGAAMTTIQGSLFKQKPYTSSLVAVVIEEGYTTIGDSAFSGCERLTRVQLPSTLTEINNSAFANTALAGDLVIPESVTKIGGSAFAGCTNLTSVTITNPTVTIGPNAFSEMTKGFTIRGLTGSTAEEYYNKYKKYGIKFEAIGEYIDPNAPTEEDPNSNTNNNSGETQENSGDVEENKTTLFGVQVDDLTLIIIIAIGALMLLLLIAGVVIVIVVVNSNDDDDDEDDEDEDDEEYDDEEE